MPVFYALVARKQTVLAEFTGRSGNFPTVTRVLLGKITEGDQKMSYIYDKYVHAIGVSSNSASWRWSLCLGDYNAFSGSNCGCRGFETDTPAFAPQQCTLAQTGAGCRRRAF